MQKTVDKTLFDRKILSIRLAPGGLSFTVGTGENPRGGEWKRFPFAGRGAEAAVRNIIDTTPDLSGYFGAVDVYVDTADTIFESAERLSGDTALELFAVAGINLAPGEGIAVSPEEDGIRAAMKYDAGALGYLREFYGSRLAFHSPLSLNMEAAQASDMPPGGIVANITERNLYVTRFSTEKELLDRAVFPYDTAADLLYYIDRLADTAELKNPYLLIFGPRAKDNYKALKKYFGRTSCE